MTGSLTCSIVIRAYNEAAHLPRLFQGIREQTLQDVEVILVDSGSTDETIRIAEENGAKIVHILPEEFTFGRSLNLGIQAATREYIVIASAHVYPVYPDWLETLLAPFENPKIAMTYGKQRGPRHAKFSEQQIFHRWYPDKSDPMQSHPFCNNANAAIRRSLWERHPYDETLTGLEDLAWAKWAMEEGFFLAYVAEAEIIHVHNETPRGVYNRYRREAMAFKRLFPDEHFGFWNALWLASGNILNDLWHARKEGALGSHWKSIFWFRWMQFWGTYRGYREAGPLTWQLRQTFYYPRGLRAQRDSTKREVQPIRYES
jgi:glycosyltransferase involved in cell wall biosynthesis